MSPDGGADDVAGTVTVAIVAICGAPHLRRCLAALDAQDGAPAFDILVVYDPHLEDLQALAGERSDVRFVSNVGQRTPLELASRAVGEASGELVLLTEDHCVPAPSWVSAMVAAQAEDRAVVGGAVEPLEGTTTADWAFYLVDYYRYMPPVGAGPSPTLTVCNASYRADRLRVIESTWSEIFHETAINDELASRFGMLWLEPSARVGMRRHVRFRDALYERYAFGRLFGCTRLSFLPAWRRFYYVVLAPALPAILFSRMWRASSRSRETRRRFRRAAAHVAALVVAWSWGEWLGYLTLRRPASELVAPEIET
ncbi:MAG: glycosyltransferase [Gemmatimonadota bacterium]|nr:glycosyltransferase [Gemmatimonadota bacterium]